MSSSNSSFHSTLPKILFYDLTSTLTIDSKHYAQHKSHDPQSHQPQPRSWSPATIRTLLALNHLQLPYTRVPVSYPDIAPLLSAKGVPPRPGAKRIFYTLPAIGLVYEEKDEETLMDSEPIAHRLQSLLSAFPMSSSASSSQLTLFPLPSQEETTRLLQKVEQITDEATDHVWKFVIPNVAKFLDPRGAEYFYRTRKEAFGRPLDDILVEAEREEGGSGKAFRDAVRIIEGFYAEERGRAPVEVKEEELESESEGVFLGGRSTPWYADFVVVAMVEWWRCAVGDEVVDKAMREAEGGLLWTVFKALEPSLYGRGP